LGNRPNNGNVNKYLMDNIYNKISKNKSKINKTSGSNNFVPYPYSAVFYFDNPFPCSNVYFFINYNANSSGQFTDYEIVTGSYGYSFGNTYSQTNVNCYHQNGILVFHVTGQFSTSIGIDEFSMYHSNFVEYTGYIQLNTPFDGGVSVHIYQQG
jgi:hypothetical protein